MAVAALVPALVPSAALVVRAASAGSEALGVAMSGRTGELLVNTAVLVVIVTTASASLGLAAAWLTERTDLPGRRVWRVVIAVPLVVPSYVIALALIAGFGTGGVVSEVVGTTIGRPHGLFGAWAALTLSTYPFVYLVSVAALRRLDPSLEEAARGLGASALRAFLTVTLPGLRPAVAAGMLLTALYTLSDFGAVSLMRFDAFTRVVYAQYQGRLDRTPAAVLAVLLVLLALAILVVESRARGRGAYHPVRPVRVPRRRRLGPAGTVAATAALVVLASAALGLPIATLTSWASRGGAEPPWGSAAGSLAAAGLAAAVAAALSVPAATLVVRHRSRGAALVERAAYAVFALPHIAVALGVVFFASRYLGGLYQSLTLLVMVYTSLFFAQALGAARDGMLRVDPALEEAARGLGRSRIGASWSVTLPLLRPSLLAGAVLVFLTTMKELPATLLLRPTGYDTLAVDIWSATDDLRYAAAARPALLLVAVSAIPMYLLATRDA